MNRPTTELVPMDVTKRIDAVRERLDGESLDALFVTNLVNIRYLTSFTGSAALLFVERDRLLFVTDGRYRDQASEQLDAAGVVADVAIGTGPAQRDEVRKAASGLARIGLESEDVTWAAQRRYAEAWFEDAELVPTSGVVSELRQVKDPGELSRIEAACAIADAAFDAVRARLGEQPTEREFALELEFEIRRRGADDVSFEPIVASGPNGAKPHARPGERRIGEGDLVVLDFGARVDGYCSDMTRTVCVGDPDAGARRQYEVVLESQAAGRAAVRAGAAAAEVDRACRAVIEDAGWGDAFLHGTGHGVGLEIHEDPRIGATSSDTLAADQVVTVEPGVYLTGSAGVRIEDTVVVGDDGCEALTRTSKELVL